MTAPSLAPGGYATSSSFGLFGVIAGFGAAVQSAASFGNNPGFLMYPFVSTPALSITAGAEKNTLSWAAAQTALGFSVSGYSVGKATASGGPYSFTAVGNVLSYADTGLTAGQAYYYRLRVLDQTGITIATSTEVSGTPSAAAPASSPSSGGSGGGGGGGGGGAIVPQAGGATVSFSGRAYPDSTVVLLKDGQMALSAQAGGDARFRFSLKDLSAGSYVFSIYGLDEGGNKSALLSFPQTLSAGATTDIGGIFISPTIGVDKSAVKRGDNIRFFGRAAASSSVVISVHSDPELFLRTQAGGDGAYLYTFDTSPLERGDHLAKSKAAVADEASGFGAAVGFVVGDRTVAQSKAKSPMADLNGDGRVNLTDFSVTLYWYKRPLSGIGLKADINHDGKVNLTDFSILLSHWTG